MAPHVGLLTVLLEPLNGTFWVGCIYGRNDDASRFGYFCGAAAEYLRVANIQCALFVPTSGTRSHRAAWRWVSN